MRFGLILALAMLSASACANPSSRASHPRDSQEIFDEQSGNTLLVVPKPLVFARERMDVAAHARDYATLVAVEIDQSGKYSEFLLLYRWSTVDRRMSPPPGPDEGELKILADGRVIDLMPLEQVPIGLSRRRELHLPEHGDVITHAYRIDVPTLRFIAESREIAVRMPQESLDAPFAIWEDGRSALGEFLRRSSP